MAPTRSGTDFVALPSICVRVVIPRALAQVGKNCDTSIATSIPMLDANQSLLKTNQREGLGTSFVCVTKSRTLRDA